MKKMTVGIVCVVFSILLLGCDAKKTTTTTDPLESLNSGSGVEGVALSNGSVELVIDSEVNATAFTEEILITNTTKIKISVQHLGENEIIDVYLYDANQADVIVAYTRLSEDEHSFTFTGLKSTIGYQIGAESINLLESKSLKITD